MWFWVGKCSYDTPPIVDLHNCHERWYMCSTPAPTLFFLKVIGGRKFVRDEILRRKHLTDISNQQSPFLRSAATNPISLSRSSLFYVNWIVTLLNMFWKQWARGSWRMLGKYNLMFIQILKLRVRVCFGSERHASVNELLWKLSIDSYIHKMFPHKEKVVPLHSSLVTIRNCNDIAGVSCHVD